MPPQYIILRQLSGQPCEVVFYDSDKQTREVLFSGGRWEARRFLYNWRCQIAWENVPCFNEKKALRGRPPTVVEMVENKL